MTFRTCGRRLALLGLLLTAPAVVYSQTLDWVIGPNTLPIGSNLAEIVLPEGFLYLDNHGTERLMELTENPLTGQEQATLAPAADDAHWFIVFEWDPMGYVEDSEGSYLDADDILAQLRQGNAEGNKERLKRGWATMSIVGWHEPPHYDATTRNLTWSVITESEGHQGINRIVKLLGRRGVMTATLVSSLEGLETAAIETDSLLTGYSFNSGSRYAEFVAGSDRMAEIGLTALIAGGAGAALVKTGLLARLWKFLVIGVVAVVAALKRFGERIFGGGHGGLQGGSQAG